MLLGHSICLVYVPNCWHFSQTISDNRRSQLGPTSECTPHPIILRYNRCEARIYIISHALYVLLRYRQVPEIRGHIPELETPLEDFRAEVLNCYDATLARVAGIHQVIISGCVFFIDIFLCPCHHHNIAAYGNELRAAHQ